MKCDKDNSNVTFTNRYLYYILAERSRLRPVVFKKNLH